MRLTNSMRSEMAAKAVEKAGFPARQKEHEKKMAEWAEKCRVHALGGAEEAKKLAAFEKRFKKSAENYAKEVVGAPFRRDYDMYMNVAGKRFHAQFSGSNLYKSRIYKTCPQECTLPASHSLAEAFEILEAEREKFENEREALRQRVRAALDSCTTVEKLLKVWPEAKELLPAPLKPTPKLPAVPVNELNVQIGLPSK